MINITNILCPVDLSDPSRLALEYATALARWYDARLTVLGVVGGSWPFMAEGYPVLYQLAPDARPNLAAALETFATPARTAGVRVEIQVEEGDVAKRILDAAAGGGADLIVMGTHGRGGFERLSLGSIAEKVMRRAECTVLTVPPVLAHDAVVPGQYKLMVYATDFSAASAAALPFALSLAQESGSRLLLLHVVEWPTDADAADAPALAAILTARHQSALTRLRTLVPDEARTWCDPEIVSVHGKAAREIVRLARDRQADVVVLGVARRNVIDVTLNGTTANEVIRTSPCPVLAVHMSDREPA